MIVINGFLLLFLNIVEYNGEIFIGEGFKIYFKRLIVNKRKFVFKESFVGGSFIVSKVLKVDNKKFFEDDYVKKVINENGKIEFVKRLIKKLLNL